MSMDLAGRLVVVSVRDSTPYEVRLVQATLVVWRDKREMFDET